MTTNDKREQAFQEFWDKAPHHKRGQVPSAVECFYAGYGAAALLREAEAASPDVSEAELAEWEALCEKAVTGPWRVQRYSNYEGWSVYSDTFGCVAERWEADAKSDARPERAQYFDVHSKLVAASRTALPRLITALRAARKREGEAVALLRRVHEKVIQGSFDGVVAVDDFIVRFLAARETTQEQKNEQ